MPARNILSLFKIILELSKVKITIAVALTTVTGYVLASGMISWDVLYPVTGIFLLACGSSVINHIQEHHTDIRMERTHNRPIPSGRISPLGAALIASIEIAGGAFILGYFSGCFALMLGMLALFWYNLVYAYLKKITPHAVIPGSVIGAIPPLVGWVGAGETLAGYNAFIMAAFFFIWQVPHFYLLSVKYHGEYEKAGFPTLFQRSSPAKIRTIIFSWIVFTGIAASVLPFTLLSGRLFPAAIILPVSVLLILFFSGLLLKGLEKRKPGLYFMVLNGYVLLITLVLIADSLF